MSKLVHINTWVSRHFEPGSEPDPKTLEEWALSENTGVIMGKILYLYDDALLPQQDAQSQTITYLDLLRVS